MRHYILNQMFMAVGIVGSLADGAAAAPPPPSHSAPTVATPSAASSAQFFAPFSQTYAPAPIGPTHPAYWTGNYGLGGILSPGYWFPSRPGSMIVTGGVQSAGAAPGSVIVAGGATGAAQAASGSRAGVIVTGGTQSAGATPGGVIVAGGPTGGVQTAGAAPSGVIVAGGPTGGVQSAGGAIIAGGASSSTNAPK